MLSYLQRGIKSKHDTFVQEAKSKRTSSVENMLLKNLTKPILGKNVGSGLGKTESMNNLLN